MTTLRFLFLLALISGAALASETFEDFTNTRVVVSSVPKRVVTLAPSVSEIVGSFFTADSSPIVGVSEMSDFPLYLKSIESVGPYDRFSVEKVLALKPDLVIATKDGNPPDRVKRLRELSIPVVVVGTSNIQELERSILVIGKALLQYPGAREKLDAFQKSQKEFYLTHRKSNCSKKIMLQVGAKPLVVVGGTSYLSQALDSLGCRNTYWQSNHAYPRPSIEDVLLKNPEQILILSMDDHSELYQLWADDWKSFKNLAATRNKKIMFLRSDALLRPSLRWVEGLKALADAIESL